MSFVADITQDIVDFRQQHPQWVVVLRGTTATGKTETSIALAQELPIEIISSDSRQIFKYMDIGTDKIPLHIRQTIPHWQIDIVTPDIHYTAGQWKYDADQAIDSILWRNQIPLIVGGTGLYIDMLYKNYTIPHVPPQADYRKTLEQQEKSQKGILRQKLQEIDPDSAKDIHPNNLRYLIRALEIYHTTGKPKSQLCQTSPVRYPLLMIGLRREATSNTNRIKKRILTQIKSWLEEEVFWLLEQGFSPNLQSMQGICYKQTVEYLYGNRNKAERIQDMVHANEHYAKKQRTRLRKYLRDAKHAPRENVKYKVYTIQ